MTARWHCAACAWILAFSLPTTARAAKPGAQGPIPVVLDTDIGEDIDDAFALAMVIQSRQVDLRAVTTVSGDTRARARIAAKMLAMAGRSTVPVAAGDADAGAPFAQAEWAKDFQAAALVATPAVTLMHQIVQQGRGKVVLIAIGRLTNVATLLQDYPEDRPLIKRIVLMGGSIAHGYEVGSGATRESNIASDWRSAAIVFASKVPLLVAPLDVTADTQLEGPQRQELFARHVPLTDALEQLYRLWGQPTPTLHDSTAVTLLLRPGLCRIQPMHVEITEDGMTRPQPGAPPNADVALQGAPAALIQYYEGLFAKP